MKRFILFLFILFLFLPVSVFAVPLEWTAPPGQVDGYIIFYNGGENWQDVGNVTTYNTDDLPLAYNRNHEFQVSAYNANGLSDKSNTVEWTKPGFVPTSNPGTVTDLNIPEAVTIAEPIQ